MNGPRDIIAPFWADLDNRQRGQIYYDQFTSGSILQQATQDINQYFPRLKFNANWVFVATWYEVAYFPISRTETTAQAVLISGGNYSFVLMNYGIIAATKYSVQAGYDTVDSIHHFSIPGSFSDSATGNKSNFRLSSNVNVPGRWAFRVDHGSKGCTYIGVLTPHSPRPLYPMSGSTSHISDDESPPVVTLQQSFDYFGQTYNQIYVNQNGHLTFNQPLSDYIAKKFPMYGPRDIIGPLWVDLDNRELGQIYYNQYTSGSVLQQATQDINTYFPKLKFNANWVFVATWYELAYYPNSGTCTTFQAVLISGGSYSFVLMNYGWIAATNRSVQAGYDTVDSIHHFSIPGSFSDSATGVKSNFHLSSNVNVPGRWAFRVDHGTTGCIFN
ncbi:alpha-tectorin-like, partial [Plectropomus leopardus]|uniref:alpha-tectorin-like n=1 Tax=Plectropomus leopardus TaxID=160734 RepID=UPI001C4B4B6D